MINEFQAAKFKFIFCQQKNKDVISKVESNEENGIESSGRQLELKFN